jgi:hypothetical protein
MAIRDILTLDTGFRDQRKNRIRGRSLDSPA